MRRKSLNSISIFFDCTRFSISSSASDNLAKETFINARLRVDIILSAIFCQLWYRQVQIQTSMSKSSAWNNTSIATFTDTKVIQEHFEHIHSIEPGLLSTHLKRIVRKSTCLEKVYWNTLFLFKVFLSNKKCTDPSCNYCSQHPVCMSASDFLFHLYLYLFILQFQTKASMLSLVTYLVNSPIKRTAQHHKLLQQPRLTKIWRRFC